MSLLTGVTSGLRVGGIFCLSGYLALAEAIQKGDDNKFKRTTDSIMPILMSIGDKDPVINPEWAHKSAGIVKDLGYDVDLTVVPWVNPPSDVRARQNRGTLQRNFTGTNDFDAICSGLGHSINQAVLRNVESFITRIQKTGASQHDEL